MPKTPKNTKNIWEKKYHSHTEPSWNVKRSKEKESESILYARTSMCITHDQTRIQILIHAMMAMTTCALVWFECDFSFFVPLIWAHMRTFTFINSIKIHIWSTVQTSTPHRQCALHFAPVLALRFSWSRLSSGIIGISSSGTCMANDKRRILEYYIRTIYIYLHVYSCMYIMLTAIPYHPRMSRPFTQRLTTVSRIIRHFFGCRRCCCCCKKSFVLFHVFVQHIVSMWTEWWMLSVSLAIIIKIFRNVCAIFLVSSLSLPSS